MTVSMRIGRVVGELDRLAGGVDQRDQPALVVVLGAHAGAAQRVDDLGQEVRTARLRRRRTA